MGSGRLESSSKVNESKVKNQSFIFSVEFTWNSFYLSFGNYTNGEMPSVRNWALGFKGGSFIMFQTQVGREGQPLAGRLSAAVGGLLFQPEAQ